MKKTDVVQEILNIITDNECESKKEMVENIFRALGYTELESDSSGTYWHIGWEEMKEQGMDDSKLL